MDTGTQANEIDRELARSIGLQLEYRVELATATGTTLVGGGRGIEVALGSVRASNAEFLYPDLRGVRLVSADIQGILGEEFMARFDFLLDLKNGRLDFGAV